MRMKTRKKEEDWQRKARERGKSREGRWRTNMKRTELGEKRKRIRRRRNEEDYR